MAVSPVLMNAVIQRTDDVALLKNQQDHRPAVEQQNLQAQITKKIEHQQHQVIPSEETFQTDTHADAREEGKNSYFRRKKQQEKKTVSKDCVVKKTSGGFDIKI